MTQSRYLKQILLALICFVGLFCNGASSPFLNWIDDTNCDNSLLNGRSLIVDALRSKNYEISFTTKPGEAFVFGDDKSNGKTSRFLKCIDGKNGQVYTNDIESLPDDAIMMGSVGLTQENHKLLHFLVEGERNQPVKSHTVVEIDDKYHVVSIKAVMVEDGDWEKFNGSNPNNLSDLGIYYSSYLASPGFTGNILWSNEPVTVLFGATGYPQQPKMYVFHGDTFLGVRRLALMPFDSIIFIKSDKQILLKAWFGVESQAAGTDQLDAKRPIATATWSLDADSISRAFITSGRWLMIDGKRGDKEVFFYYDLTEILNRAAKKYAPDAQADW